MTPRFRLPMFVVAAALLGLIALLATLQYRWLGQISTAERERMRTNLASRTGALAQDFDREVTRAFLIFQADVMRHDDNAATRVSASYDRWQATSPYPRLLKDIYIVSSENGVTLRRFDAASRFLAPAEWPDHLHPVRDAVSAAPAPAGQLGAMTIRTMMPTIWENIPAMVLSTPVLLLHQLEPGAGPPTEFKFTSALHYTVLAFDRAYISNEMLPALAQQHFSGASEGDDYDFAVVSRTTKSLLYTTDRAFSPDPEATGDAAADMFQIRVQDHPAMANEVRRWTSVLSRPLSRIGGDGTDERKRERELEERRVRELRGTLVHGEATGSFTVRDAPSMSVVVQHNLATADARKGFEAGVTLTRPKASPWRIVVKHPSGSLETAVANVRRRNLVVSSGILAVLGVSVGFLVVSTRRAQDLARQQMEFVAAVSHELRTPLAVIRSAADNLAEGVVHGDAPVRKYGELVRGEGRRLSEMVEQILELAGIQSGQRSFALRPVAVLPLLHDVVRASGPLLQDAGIEVEYELPETIPPVLGDEQALRRVFQNLIGNALKYGAEGRWIGVTARVAGREVQVTVSDRGIGIEPSEQANIFKPFYRTPDVIAAQIQGAGLGLSLVQKMVEAHGGRITLQSAPGKGSAFTVHLPSASEEPLPRATSAHDPATSGA